MKQEKKISLDILYKELRDYCLEVLVDNASFWRGDAGGDERMVRAKFAYLIGVSDAIRYMNSMLMYYSEEPSEENTQDEEDD